MFIQTELSPCKVLLVPTLRMLKTRKSILNAKVGTAQVEKDVNKAIALMEEVETEIGRKKEVRHPEHILQRKDQAVAHSAKNDLGALHEDSVTQLSGCSRGKQWCMYTGIATGEGTARGNSVGQTRGCPADSRAAASPPTAEQPPRPHPAPAAKCAARVRLIHLSYFISSTKS